MRAIVLMGFMGTGKSEVGRRLAKRMGRAFTDTDQLVEQRAGRTVREIFAADGEPAFRALERDAVADAARRGGVIAVGGGAVLDPANVAALRGAGVLVHLTATADVIRARIGDAATRPLLAGRPDATLERLMGERQAAYAAAADLTVDTAARTVDEVVEEIRSAVAGVKPDDRCT
jgi:shikimate kinase